VTDREQGRTDELEEFASVDPDIALITRWLAEELTPEAEAAVEARLEEDEAFFDKVAPLMRIWTMPVRFGDLVADRPAESPHEAIEAPKGRVRETLQPVPADERRERRDKRPRARRPRFLYAWAQRKITRKAAAWITGIGLLTVSVPLASHFAKVSREQQELLRKQGVPVTAKPTPTLGIPFKTPPGPPRTVRFANGSYARLGPDSHFRYKIGPGPVGLWAHLDGEATIEVGAVDRALFLETTSGTALLMSGTYAVRCVKGCKEMRLTVGTGYAALRGDSTTAKVVLKSGEFGRAPRGGAAERTEGGKGYPVIVSRKQGAP
jgi:hypothetical protein